MAPLYISASRRDGGNALYIDAGEREHDGLIARGAKPMNASAMISAAIAVCVAAAPLAAAPLAADPPATPAPPAPQIDALVASPANFRLMLENEFVRVLEYTLLPGQKDRRHTHPKRVAHVILGGTLRVGFPDGTHRDFVEVAGTSEYNGPSPPHDTQNIGTTPIRILLVEVKDAPKP